MTAPPTLPIRTERLLLRELRSDDVEALLAYYGDPEVARYLLEEPWTRADAEEQIARRVGRMHVAAEGDGIRLAVERDGVLIGDLCLWAADATLSRAEVGWAFHPAYGGQGYATEAVRALLDLAFGHYGMHRVRAQLDPRNTASARLCERVGMVKEAHLREDWFSKGEWTDNAIYGLLAAEHRD